MQWGNDYMHARYYSSNLGRFLSVDPVGGTVGSSQSWNRYSYVVNNPIVLIDPDGRNWFNVGDSWEWHDGDTYTYQDADGNDVSLTSEYTHLIIFEKTGTNAEGGTEGTLTIFDQQNAVFQGTAFSGGADGFPEIPSGTFRIGLGLQRNPANDASDLTQSGDLRPNYGFQEISASIVDSGGQAWNFRWDWGSARAHLNETSSSLPREYRGNYLHGKQNPANVTHGCICDRSEGSLNYLRNLDPNTVPWVPVWVR